MIKDLPFSTVRFLSTFFESNPMDRPKNPKSTFDVQFEIDYLITMKLKKNLSSSPSKTHP